MCIFNLWPAQQVYCRKKQINFKQSTRVGRIENTTKIFEKNQIYYTREFSWFVYKLMFPPFRYIN